MFQEVLLQVMKILLLNNFSQFSPSVDLRDESVSENLGHLFRSGTLITIRYIQVKALKTDNTMTSGISRREWS